MGEERREDALGSDERAMHYCELCDEPRRHMIKYMGADNKSHYICWSCRNREEKRINLKPTWKRTGRQV